MVQVTVNHMPYEWKIELKHSPQNIGACLFSEGSDPIACLHLWPYRSLPKRDFVRVLALAFLGFLLPVLAFVGSVVLWGLLIPAMATLWLLWFFINKSYRDGEILEELSIWSDHITLTRTGPKGRVQQWQANPYWVKLQMHAHGGPVKNYLTLKGNDRMVELGAFLSEDERPKLRAAVQSALSAARKPGP